MFCRDKRPVRRAELEDFMGHWGWLDEPARFEPPLDESVGADSEWGYFELWYRDGKRPIQVRHWITRDEIQPTIDELKEEFKDALSDHPEVAKHLSETRQAFVFEMGADLPEDVWEMLDVTEAFLARERDGIVVAWEGIYDAQLKLLLALRDRPPPLW